MIFAACGELVLEDTRHSSAAVNEPSSGPSGTSNGVLPTSGAQPNGPEPSGSSPLESAFNPLEATQSTSSLGSGSVQRQNTQPNSQGTGGSNINSNDEAETIAEPTPSPLITPIPQPTPPPWGPLEFWEVTNRSCIVGCHPNFETYSELVASKDSSIAEILAEDMPKHPYNWARFVESGDREILLMYLNCL
jgi:hypothetical protein